MSRWISRISSTGQPRRVFLCSEAYAIRMAILTVRCPKCGHDQKYQPMGVAGPGSCVDIVVKAKRCVYCGRSFKVHSCLPKTRIVQAA